jgi:16S rRNA (cytidine1402-2'-O)-methyltransferase
MGTLYVVGTPIGNLEDITLRALRVLRECALIAAEDTRKTRILLDRYGIEKPMISYFEHNEAARIPQILEALAQGDVALVSEAGMPGLSDPGYVLIRAALERGFPVVPIPGPSAPVTALVVSGLPADRFLFLGFLPRKPGERRRLLAQVAALPWTLVAFEAPHRLRETLRDILEILGDRPMAVARELTKIHEEIRRGTVREILTHFAEVEPRGEFTLVIAGASEEVSQWEEEEVRARLEELLRSGRTPAQAAREVARASGWPRDAVYRMALRIRSESEPRR